MFDPAMFASASLVVNVKPNGDDITQFGVSARFYAVNDQREAVLADAKTQRESDGSMVVDVSGVTFAVLTPPINQTAKVYGDMTLGEARAYAAYLSSRGEPADSDVGQAYAAVSAAIAAWFAAGN
ncbi:MAG TPA: hypothetical protein VGM37_01435 [Armatimonadota bacterium]|jgi:hypothetical protein